MGMLGDSWAGGIRSVTGSHFPAPRGRAAGQLAEVLRADAAKAGAVDACDHAHELAQQYAKANVGRTLSSFHFADWLGSGKPAAKSGPRIVPARGVQPAGAGGKSLWKVGEGAGT